MGKKGEPKPQKISRLDAIDIHRAVLGFLKDHSLLATLCNDAKPGIEAVIVSRLATEQHPVFISDLAKMADAEPGTVSQARRRVNDYLAEFCTTRVPLSTTGTLIQIPGGGKSEKTRCGYYFAFYSTKEGRILTSKEAMSLREQVHSDRVESLLRNTLKKEAFDSLSEKLVGRDDYQPLEVEIGVFEDKQTACAMADFDRVTETGGYQRVWRSFELASLLDLEGQYVLVSETGAGKTTFLRSLQMRILEKRKRLPICLHAAEMEHWAYKGLTALFRHIANHLELECEREAVAAYLKKCADRVFVLVDGLDQIAGVGTAYERFVKHLIDVSKEGGISLLIASRPTAVVCL